jgi:hypothetical protein
MHECSLHIQGMKNETHDEPDTSSRRNVQQQQKLDITYSLHLWFLAYFRGETNDFFHGVVLVTD